MPRPAQVRPSSLTLLLEARGPTSALELAAAVGVDRSNVSRALATLGDAVVRVGAARRTRYALRRRVRAAGDRWPLYRIDAEGRARVWAQWEAVHGGGRLTWSEAAPAWADRVVDADGLVEGLPFFLGDMRPQGFLGRGIARRVSEVLLLPADPRSWSDDDNLVFLQAEGDDLPGDLVVGDGPLRRALARQVEPVEAVAAEERGQRYPELAGAVIGGAIAGSSAGGEQPKFLTRVQRAGGGVPEAVLVKFTPPLETRAGRRWADLLAAEAHAHAVLAEHGLATGSAEILDAGGRRFLEVVRYDRVGLHGRRGVISLEAVHGALARGDATNWLGAAEGLARDGLLDAAGMAAVRRQGLFGELIGNVDMHFGNLAFWRDDTLPLRPTPAYDMLPMAWAPTAQGEVVERAFAPRPPVPSVATEWSDAARWAETFWARVETDLAVSPDFREQARQAGERVRALRERFG